MLLSATTHTSHMMDYCMVHDGLLQVACLAIAWCKTGYCLGCMKAVASVHDGILHGAYMVGYCTMYAWCMMGH